MKTNLLIVSQRGLPRCSGKGLGSPLLAPKLSGPKSGFTRLELAAVMGSMLLLLAVALPAVANKARSQQVGCFNNLRQIGRAFHMWGNDHNELLPFYVPIAAEGSQNPTLRGTASWMEFAALSNELKTARVLACPSDNKRPADEFSNDPTKGLFHANFRNSAVSYLIGHPFWREPNNILSGDRNLRMDYENTGCSIFGSVSAIRLQYATVAGWTNSIHQTMGHLLRMDGRVEPTDNRTLLSTLGNTGDDNNLLHFLVP